MNRKIKKQAEQESKEYLEEAIEELFMQTIKSDKATQKILWNNIYKIQTAIDSLEKEIRISPITSGDIYYCPKCNQAYIGKLTNYCEVCGQRIGDDEK